MFVLGIGEQNGDRAERLGELYERHVSAVFRYAFKCVGRRELAEDLTSEAFLTLHRNLDNVDSARLPAWLFTVVKNLAVDHWRKRSREQDLPDVIPAAEPKVEVPVEEVILKAKGLKPVHRLCLTLRYVHGMDRPEIAKRTGMSDNQIKSALRYALELLRKELNGKAGV